MAGKGNTSPWVYVGCGCGAAAILGVAALVGLLVFGARKARELGEELKDPETRRERVVGVLGGEIPEGYYPVVGMEIPFLMEMAMLGDQPPGEDGEIDDPMGERGFIYLRMRARKSKRQQVEDFFEGRTNDLDALRQSNINLGRGELIDRGAFDLDTFGVRWIAQRGEVAMGSGSSDGITSVILFTCPNDKSGAQRIGIWFGPDAATPAAAESVESAESAEAEVDLTGTPADENALRAFLGHFAPCG